MRYTGTTYKESYMKCKTLEELEKEVNSDIAIAYVVGSLDRIDIIKRACEEVANLKFNKKNRQRK